ncbi:MAG: hypothetical protein ABSC22_01665 [Roseiarcus sp.]|jgi:hypothetical protein
MAKENLSATMKVKVALAWCFVGVPLAWGVLQTIANAMALFR